MRLIKRLHIFMLQTFLPLFAMTFFIVLFIVLMQFLWKYIDDLVGKGVSFDVLAELFFYAAVSMVPMALPLAILLASLMTFGNLGERFELTAMKASGISLIRVMAPLIVLISGISVGAFFFQNNILPHAQVKMWTLLFSLRQKSPELEIPEGVFYDQIPGYNLIVQDKNQQTGMLHDVMIYDVSRGGDNATILLADSARIAMTANMSHLYLHLYQGEQFENLRDQNTSARNVPFRRESFLDKEILIPFDANFNRLDEEGMRKQYVGKNIDELNHTIDSVSRRVDSIGDVYAEDLIYRVENSNVFSASRYTDPPAGKPAEKPKQAKTLNIDSLLKAMPLQRSSAIVQSARDLVQMEQEQFQFKSISIADEKKTIRRHEIELIKKFTLSVACLVFFFIGAPLGAIIRKGGIGTPLVISVLLFVFYYIIDNTGYKMARDGRWIVPAGMWLSTAVLVPIGIYVTWKAMNDSAVFEKDRYIAFLRRIAGLPEKRRVDFKEVIINDISPDTAREKLEDVIRTATAIERLMRRTPAVAHLLKAPYSRPLGQLAEKIDGLVEYLTDSRDKQVILLLQEYPLVTSGLYYRVMRGRLKRTLASIKDISAKIEALI